MAFVGPGSWRQQSPQPPDPVFSAITALVKSFTAEQRLHDDADRANSDKRKRHTRKNKNNTECNKKKKEKEKMVMVTFESSREETGGQRGLEAELSLPLLLFTLLKKAKLRPFCRFLSSFFLNPHPPTLALSLCLCSIAEEGNVLALFAGLTGSVQRLLPSGDT